MKKSLKKHYGVLAVVALMGSAVFAQTAMDVYERTDLSSATGGAVKNEYSYYMDLLNWNKLEFKNLYLTTQFETADANRINLSTAFKSGANVFEVKYTGDLWADDSNNSFYGFWGNGNLGVMAAYSYLNNFAEFPGTSVSVPTVAAGYNLNQNWGVYGGFSYAFAEVENNVLKTNFSMPVISVGTEYVIGNSGALSHKAGVMYSFTDTKTKNTVKATGNTTETSIKANTIIGTYNLEYSFTKTFKYGLEAEGAFGFGDVAGGNSVVTFESYVTNGFVAQIVPERFSLAGGLKTTLPSVEKLKDSDGDEISTTMGNVDNTVSFGGAFYFAPEVFIEFGTQVDLYNGMSIEDILASPFRLSFTAKF